MSMPPAFSTYLDLVRAICAIAVVFYHYSNHIVRGPGRVFPDVGYEAVMVFFVLSGFLIAYVAKDREGNATTFFAKRFARIYPVAIAGVGLSYLLYGLCGPRAPGLYAGYVSPHAWWREVGLTLGFVNQTWWFPHLMPPANRAYWSLACEVWFYVLGGCIFFARTRWTVAAIVVALPLLGPRIMLLFPVWVAGVWTQRFCDRQRLSPAVAATLAVSSLLAAVALWASDARADWRVPSDLAVALRLGRASEFAYYYVLATIVGVHFFATYNLLSSVSRWPDPVYRCIRQAAETSFSLYAMHFPILFALRSWLPNEPFVYFFPLATVALVLIFGRPIENLRFPVYGLLRRRTAAAVMPVVNGPGS